MQACLQSMKAQRTTITVAHRLSTIMDADTIVVLDDGRIVETGSHSELLARRGKYSQLWQQQQSSPSVDNLAAQVQAQAQALAQSADTSRTSTPR